MCLPSACAVLVLSTLEKEDGENKTLTRGPMEKPLCSMYHITLLESIKQHNKSSGRVIARVGRQRWRQRLRWKWRCERVVVFDNKHAGISIAACIAMSLTHMAPPPSPNRENRNHNRLVAH